MNGCAIAAVSEIRPSVTAAISAMPDESPSSPSMKLMLLIMPRIQSIENPIANGPVRRMFPGPERVGDERDGDPGEDGEQRRGRAGPGAASGRGAGTCRRGRPAAVATAPPARSPTSSSGAMVRGTGTSPVWPLSQIPPRATRRNEIATATPPPRGTGALLTRRPPGWSTLPRRIATRRTSGVRTSEAGRRRGRRRPAGAGTPRPWGSAASGRPGPRHDRAGGRGPGTGRQARGRPPGSAHGRPRRHGR